MTEPDHETGGPPPEPDPHGRTGAGEQLPPDRADEPPAGEPAGRGPDDDLTWDLPESDHAYVMASLTRISGDQTEFNARLRVAEDRIEDLAAGLDDIEDAATAAVTSGPADVTGDVGGRPSGPDPETGPTGDQGPADDDAQGDDAAAQEAEPEGIDMVELVAWVRDHVALLLERKLPQTGTPPHWCRKWWMHAEAIARFESLRRGWVEAVTGDGNAMVVWFEHLDLMLGVLMGDGGTFSGCTGGEHRAGAVRMLGHDEPDAAYFADFDLLHTG